MPAYSYSRLQLFDRCPFAWKCRYVDEVPEIKSESLITGSDLHEFLASYINHCIKEGVQTDLEYLDRYAFPDRGTLNRDIQAIAHTVKDTFTVPREALTGPAMVEKKLAFNRFWNPVEWDDPQAFFRGIIDLFHIEGALGVVTDHKSNRQIMSKKDVEGDLQLMIYAYLVFLLHPEIDEALPRLNFLRYGCAMVSGAVLTRADVSHVPDLIARKAAIIEAEKDFPPKQNSFCEWCGYRSHCPLMEKALTVREFHVDTVADATRAAQAVQMAELAIKDLKERLKGWVESHGAIRVDDRELGFVKQVKRQFEAEEVVNKLLSYGVSRDEVWNELSLTQTAIKRLLKGLENKERLSDIMAMAVEIPETRFKWTKVQEGGK